MDELLVPYGIHKETGEIVEPEDSPKGRGCNCLCPGCNAPLLSRHSTKIRTHFAHDSRHEDAKPEQECPFSAAVAVAMMVRTVAAHIVDEFLKTPSLDLTESYSCCGLSKSLKITRESRNTISDAQADVKIFDHHGDLLLKVGDYPILVDLVYDGKPAIVVDERVLQLNNVAVLELNCESFSNSNLKRDRDLRFSEAVVAFVLADGFRRWSFHPRTSSLRHKAHEMHRCITPGSYAHGLVKGGHQVVLVPNHKSSLHRREPTHYQCIACNLEWMHDYSRSLRCPECHSHLFLRQIP